jgi:hypothetical protein
MRVVRALVIAGLVSFIGATGVLAAGLPLPVPPTKRQFAHVKRCATEWNHGHADVTDQSPDLYGNVGLAVATWGKRDYNIWVSYKGNCEIWFQSTGAAGITDVEAYRYHGLWDQSPTYHRPQTLDVTAFSYPAHAPKIRVFFPHN